MLHGHFYVVIGTMILLGNLLYLIVSRRPGFSKLGRGRKMLVDVGCFLAPLLLVGIPYTLWTSRF